MTLRQYQHGLLIGWNPWLIVTQAISRGVLFFNGEKKCVRQVIGWLEIEALSGRALALVLIRSSFLL